MICDDVRRVAYFYLDGQLSERRATDFHLHLAECPDCDKRLEIHRRIRSLVRTRLQSRPAPEGLHQRIRTIFESSLRVPELGR